MSTQKTVKGTNFKIMTFKVLVFSFFALAPFLSWSQSNTIRFALSNKSHPMSYGSDGGKVEGFFNTLISHLDSKIKKYDFEIRGYNWQRAQAMVHSGEKDAYCTYPSDERKKYSLFTKAPLFVQDYGYIIFNKKHKNASEIKKIKSLKDLDQFKFISQSGVKWEEDNIPSTVKRIYVNSIEQLSYYLFLRNEGDFFVMPPEQAYYYAQLFGYLSDVGVLKVNFIPNSNVNYHVGISLKNPLHKELVELIDKKLHSNDFINFRKEVLNQFKK